MARQGGISMGVGRLEVLLLLASVVQLCDGIALPAPPRTALPKAAPANASLPRPLPHLRENSVQTDVTSQLMQLQRRFRGAARAGSSWLAPDLFGDTAAHRKDPAPPLVFSMFASEGGDTHQVITHIALCILTASVLGFIMKVTNQPLILGYILSGVAIGPIGMKLITEEREIMTVSEIGLILLLFMIGLEIDLHQMFLAGRLVIVTGLVQFPICVSLGYGVFKGLETLGFQVGSGPYGTLYVAMAISISSTMIAVKLLYDKFELDTLPGRVTVGILVFQDIWAIMLMAVQPNLNDPQVLAILGTFGACALLVLLAGLCAKFVLPWVYRRVAKLPELMLIISLGWCFCIALLAAHPKMGLSMEMGALIAGTSMATFPYSTDVTSKVTSIRDFFLTLFFVALGMQIPIPTVRLITISAVIVATAIFARVVGIFAVLELLGAGHRTSVLVSINLGQISEFTLVIMTLGVMFGHVDRESVTCIILAFSVMAVLSPYSIHASHDIQAFLSKVLTRIGIKDLSDVMVSSIKAKDRPIVILGYFHVASHFVDHLRRYHPAMLQDIMVVDFNPEMREKLEVLEVPCVYGDVSSAETLHHADIGHATVVICSIPDSMLKGTSNRRLLDVVKELCPGAQVILLSERPQTCMNLYDAGADFVLQPSQYAGAALVTVVQAALAGTMSSMKEECMDHLQDGIRGSMIMTGHITPKHAGSSPAHSGYTTPTKTS